MWGLLLCCLVVVGTTWAAPLPGSLLDRLHSLMDDVTDPSSISSGQIEYLPKPEMIVTSTTMKFQMPKIKDLTWAKYQILYKPKFSGEWKAYNLPAPYEKAFPETGLVKIEGLIPGMEYNILSLIDGEPNLEAKVITKEVEIPLGDDVPPQPTANWIIATENSISFKMPKKAADPTSKYQILYKGSLGVWQAYNHPASYEEAFPDMGLVKIVDLKPDTEYSILCLIDGEPQEKEVKVITKATSPSGFVDYLPAVNLTKVTDNSISFKMPKFIEDSSWKYQLLYKNGVVGKWKAYNYPALYEAFPDLGLVDITGLEPSTEYSIFCLIDGVPKGKEIKVVTKPTVDILGKAFGLLKPTLMKIKETFTKPAGSAAWDISAMPEVSMSDKAVVLEKRMEQLIKSLLDDKMVGTMMDAINEAIKGPRTTLDLAAKETSSSADLPSEPIVLVTDTMISFQIDTTSKYQILYKEGIGGEWKACKPSALLEEKDGWVTMSGLQPSTEYILMSIIDGKPLGKEIKFVTKEARNPSDIDFPSLIADMITDTSIAFKVPKLNPDADQLILYKAAIGGKWKAYNDPAPYDQAFPDMGLVSLTGLKPSTAYSIMHLIDGDSMPSEVKVITMPRRPKKMWIADLSDAHPLEAVMW